MPHDSLSRAYISSRNRLMRIGTSFSTVIVTLFLMGIGALGAGFLIVGGDEEDATSQMTHIVQRGLFRHDVVERGEVESSSNVEIHCEVKSQNSDGTAILEVVAEGTRVKPGDLLVRLDSSALEQELVQQQILCNTSEALKIKAENDYESALIGKKEYIEGTFREQEQVIQDELFVAEENLRRAQQYSKFSERLAAKGYVTALQLEGDRFAVEKARNEVDTARTKLRVLQEYTKEKTLKELEAAIRTNAATLKAETKSHELELDKLKDIEEQIAKCEIRAPQEGTVVYANKQSRRSDSEFVVEQGALVRERQIIVRLPDPRQMQVKALISESRVTLIKVGMQVEVRLDAFGDATVRGEVIKVNEYPEPGSWFSSQVKEYATFIKIFNPPPKIRPGLTAEARIHISTVDDVLQIPVQAIHEHGRKLYCMLKTPNGWEAREIEIGDSNDKFVIIHSGIVEGDEISMNPRGLLDQVNLPELTEEEKKSIDGIPASEPPTSEDRAEKPESAPEDVPGDSLGTAEPPNRKEKLRVPSPSTNLGP